MQAVALLQVEYEVVLLYVVLPHVLPYVLLLLLVELVDHALQFVDGRENKLPRKLSLLLLVQIQVVYGPTWHVKRRLVPIVFRSSQILILRGLKIFLGSGVVSLISTSINKALLLVDSHHTVVQ